MPAPSRTVADWRADAHDTLPEQHLEEGHRPSSRRLRAGRLDRGGRGHPRAQRRHARHGLRPRAARHRPGRCRGEQHPAGARRRGGHRGVQHARGQRQRGEGAHAVRPSAGKPRHRGGRPVVPRQRRRPEHREIRGEGEEGLRGPRDPGQEARGGGPGRHRGGGGKRRRRPGHGGVRLRPLRLRGRGVAARTATCTTWSRSPTSWPCATTSPSTCRPWSPPRA